MAGRKRYDLTGQRFGRLVAIRPGEPNKWGASTWVCLCDCGTEKVTDAAGMRRGVIKSCGCLKRGPREDWQRNPGKHGGSKHPLYSTWANMRRRCTNPADKSWPDYGGRGISVAPEWDDFWRFVEYMGERPAGYSLDRIDNDGDYRPGNVRWAPARVQTNNRRNPIKNRDVANVLAELELWKSRAIDLGWKDE